MLTRSHAFFSPPSLRCTLPRQLDRHPKLRGIFDTVVLAVNMNYVDKGDTCRLSENDEVAVIPPIGGG